MQRARRTARLLGRLLNEVPQPLLVLGWPALAEALRARSVAVVSVEPRPRRRLTGLVSRRCPRVQAIDDGTLPVQAGSANAVVLVESAVGSKAARAVAECQRLLRDQGLLLLVVKQPRLTQRLWQSLRRRTSPRLAAEDATSLLLNGGFGSIEQQHHRRCGILVTLGRRRSHPSMSVADVNRLLANQIATPSRSCPPNGSQLSC